MTTGLGFGPQDSNINQAPPRPPSSPNPARMIPSYAYYAGSEESRRIPRQQPTAQLRRQLQRALQVILTPRRLPHPSQAIPSLKSRTSLMQPHTLQALASAGRILRLYRSTASLPSRLQRSLTSSRTTTRRKPYWVLSTPTSGTSLEVWGPLPLRRTPSSCWTPSPHHSKRRC